MHSAESKKVPSGIKAQQSIAGKAKPLICDTKIYTYNINFFKLYSTFR